MNHALENRKYRACPGFPGFPMIETSVTWCLSPGSVPRFRQVPPPPAVPPTRNTGSGRGRRSTARRLWAPGRDTGNAVARQARTWVSPPRRAPDTPSYRLSADYGDRVKALRGVSWALRGGALEF